jgi:hypothetical protein
VERLTPLYVHDASLSLLPKSLGYKYRGARKGGKKMTMQLNEIVLNNYCRYDLHSGCVGGEEDTLTCARCVAESAAGIVRVQL